MDPIEVTAPVWIWRPAKANTAGWFFATIDPQAAVEIRYAAMGMTAGFGSIRVTVTVGATRWRTSLFPHKETGGLLLPLKAEVRRREAIVAGQNIVAVIEL